MSPAAEAVSFHNPFPPSPPRKHRHAGAGLVRSRLQERFQAFSLAKIGSEHQCRPASDSGGLSLPPCWQWELALAGCGMLKLLNINSKL